MTEWNFLQDLKVEIIQIASCISVGQEERYTHPLLPPLSLSLELTKLFEGNEGWCTDVKHTATYSCLQSNMKQMVKKYILFGANQSFWTSLNSSLVPLVFVPDFQLYSFVLPRPWCWNMCSVRASSWRYRDLLEKSGSCCHLRLNILTNGLLNLQDVHTHW